MKRLPYSLILLLFLCSALQQSRAQGFTVEDAEINITVYREDYFDVEERYQINYTVPKHGMYRTIYTKYALPDSTGLLKDYRIRIDEISVPNWHFSASSALEMKMDGELTIRIGDKNRVVSGDQSYIIRYRVHHAFVERPTETFFYWNIKSSNWLAQFKKLRFSITFSQAPELTPEDYALYAGPDGTTAKDTSFKLSYVNGVLSGEDTSAHYWLKPYAFVGSSLTMRIRLPKGYITTRKSAGWLSFITDYGWVLFFPVLSLIYYAVHHRYGRDRKLPVVVNYFPPPHMDPAMAGFLVNDQEDNNDLIALLPYWGNQGLIAIEQIPKTTRFGQDDMLIRKLKELPSETPDYARIIFNGLFPTGRNAIVASALSNSFYVTMQKARASLKKAAIDYYDPKAEKIEKKVSICLVFTAILGALTGIYIWGSVLASVLITVFCVGLLLLNRIMRRRNAMGDTLHQELMGFSLFIKTAEKYKLKMLLKQDPAYFEKTMAYACYFGWLNDWGRKFEALAIELPGWYQNNGTAFSSPAVFTSSLGRALSGAGSHMVSAPSSSGGSGGSSGGGFGGGGGGSW